MDADEGRFLGIDLASCEGEVVGIVEGNGVEVAVEIAELGGHEDGLVALDEFLGAAAVFDELGDGAGLEAVLFLVIAELADAGHGAVLAHDLTDCADGRESGEGGEVDGGFGVAGAAEDTAGHGLQRENVAGFHQVLGVRLRIGKEADGEGAVGGGDAGGDALGGVHGDGERGFHALMVAAGHLRKVEFLGALRGKGRADQPAAVDCHEVHHLARAERGGSDQIGLVLAIRIVGNDHEFSGGDIGDDLADGVENERRHVWVKAEMLRTETLKFS